MADDSSDGSELDARPSGSRGRYPTRSSDPKRKRRIVMRIEFDDSDESSSSATASDHSSSDAEDIGSRRVSKNMKNHDDSGPSCSLRLRSRQNQKVSAGNNNDNKKAGCDDDEDYDEFQRNAAQRRLRGRRSNLLDIGISDGSSSGSEVITFTLHNSLYFLSVMMHIISNKKCV